MKNLKLKYSKMIIDYKNDNRILKSTVFDSDKVLKSILITATYEYIILELGKEFLNDQEKMQKWMETKTEEMFDEFQNYPEVFESFEIQNEFSSSGILR